MRVFKTVLGMAGGLLLWLAAGCATPPYTDRTQFITLSESEELQLGDEAWQEVLKECSVSKDEKQNAMLKEVATRLIAVADRPNYQWEYVVVDDDATANAFALPGGKIAVYSGLFPFVNSVDDLAVVVSHEVAHALARHSAERMSQQTMIALGSLLTDVAFESNQGANLAYSVISQYGFTLRYSREQEYEADHIGLILMLKSGFDVDCAIPFWERFDPDRGYDRLTQYASTHPRGAARAAEIAEALPELKKKYGKTD